MTTHAPLDDRIVKRDNQVFPNLFGEEGGDLSANTVNCVFLNSQFVNCEQIDRLTAGDLQINNDTTIVGDLTLNGNLDLVATTGRVRLTNVILSGTSGSTSGQHLQVLVNGTLYKIELKNA